MGEEYGDKTPPFTDYGSGLKAVSGRKKNLSSLGG